MAPKSQACALPGELSTSARNRLPDSAFALPRQRKYPLYRLVNGKLVPDGSHAANAKARARQQLDRGNLTRAQYARIVAKADRVLAQCSARGGTQSENAALRGALRRDA